MKRQSTSNIFATNRKASFDYALLDRFEAGIELKGAEVKSIRDGKINLNDSFVRIDKQEAFLHGAHISPYKQSGPFAPDPIRIRRLLLHKSEIAKLNGITAQKGYTIVPTKVYFKKAKVKIEIAVAKGKRFFDKRQKLRERRIEREMQRSLKSQR
ncbi:MAG: SsrA-binding protein SmpB [Candidatus Omnitrophica bacterium]|nr:SsrA-binding protein SmpB [Candidatus Omnitrophota bacterium]